MELITVEIEKEDGSKLKTDVPKGLFCKGCQHLKSEDFELDGIPHTRLACHVMLPEMWAKMIKKDDADILLKRIRKSHPCRKACDERWKE